jgi:hypothetical protein
MTHDHVAGFASELVKMAQAMERVPQLEQEIRTLRAENDHNLTELERLRHDLNMAKLYTAELEQKRHDAEASRDDAELRFLECDDAKDTLVRILDNLGKDILGALQAVAPMPKAEDQRPEASMTTVMEAKSLTSIDDGSYTDDPRLGVPVSSAVMEALCVDAPLTGQSEPDPTVPTVTPTKGVTGTASVPDTAATGEGVSVLSDPTPDGTTASPQSASCGSASTQESAASIETSPSPFVPTPTSPSALSSSADVGDTEHIQRDPYYDSYGF